MDDAKVVARPTLAELQGMTAELGRGIAGLARTELEEGRLEAAHDLLEGLAITNPKDPIPWAMLSQVERRRGRLVAARLCAEVAVRLAPDDEQVRLVRAEALLADPREAGRGRGELRALAEAPGAPGERARALLRAMGELPLEGAALAAG
ncbi:hypothetical protein [Anaeromyxobacter paludicola]|uniref:Tetratricopeptide repeat protein n=1 Tax=Anaeromyxobacter paludicola TaxID=2918171 RepID=A0ABM7X8F9_9BACT|nr:hypothetical protein [Anaeromyxobacter paludicola]BDG08123.1 hypothetical protein AMPC_12360 [Anaeromyxobacter paludicola]